MPFIESDFVVRPVDDRRWKLLRPVVYWAAHQTFTVPAHYVTDFASVPRVAVWLIPTFGRYTRAAILHDYLITDMIPSGLIDPVDVDGVFRRVMRELGVPPVRRWLMWTGVRWGALLNPTRRAGWSHTAPTVLGITILALPLLPVMAAVALGLGLYGLAELIATRGRHSGTLKT